MLVQEKEDRTSNNLTKYNTHVNATNIVNSAAITHSNSEINALCPHKGSTKSKVFSILESYHIILFLSVDLANMNDQRRVSMGAAMKSNFVVSQSDLWDTQTLSHAKHRAPRNHSPSSRCPDHIYANQQQSGQPTPTQQTPTSSIATTPQHEHYYENGSPGGHSTGSNAPIQRSVSEKNRKHRHKQKVPVCQSETDSEREQRAEMSAQLCAQNRKLAKNHHSHHQSTPIIPPDNCSSQSSIKQHKHRAKSREHHHHHRSSNLYGASSESELLDGDTAILPIFRKLLTEKEPRYRANRNSVGASCPNISIKCDIVEYL